MRNSPKWTPDHPHFFKTDEEIKEEWALTCKKASAAGTGLHDAIDKYLNNALDTEPDTKEWAMFKEFMQTLEATPYRTEWKIYNEDCGICGTLDFIARNEDGTYTIIDWKRSKSIYKPRSMFISNTTYWHYTIQLNLYKYILEEKYDMKISKLVIVQMHPEKKGLVTYDIPCRRFDIINYIREKKEKEETKT
jgi:CRISPR/Cas system-associated exonuclease Cas4 (RecB family)